MCPTHFSLPREFLFNLQFFSLKNDIIIHVQGVYVLWKRLLCSQRESLLAVKNSSSQSVYFFFILIKICFHLKRASTLVGGKESLRKIEKNNKLKGKEKRNNNVVSPSIPPCCCCCCCCNFGCCQHGTFQKKIIDIYYRLMMTILERRQQYVQNNAFWHFLY